jgi:hypothetical protein
MTKGEIVKTKELEKYYNAAPMNRLTVQETNYLFGRIYELEKVLSDLINVIEFLNPFSSGHPSIKLRVDLDKAKKILEER